MFVKEHRYKLERGVRKKLVRKVDVEVLVLEVQCHQVLVATMVASKSWAATQRENHVSKDVVVLFLVYRHKR